MSKQVCDILNENLTDKNVDNNLDNNEVDSITKQIDEDKERYSAIQKYENEWSQLFDTTNIENLKQTAQNGMLRASRFRSVCWRVLLDVLSNDHTQWIIQIKNMRCHYRKIKAQMTTDPRKNLQISDDPLSQNSQSIWYQHFCDKELRGVIRQDVDRTFPGIEFFRKEHIQNVMVDILFIYARVHPIMCYRQGMHEILAPLLFVIHCDQQAMLHTKEHGILSITIEQILNPEYLEEDGYALFETIMNGIEFCYFIKDLEPTKTGYFPSNVGNQGSHQNNQIKNCPPENEIVSRLKYIRDYLLHESDPDLCEHLQSLDISFSLFGIRWLRLLFGREFPLQDLLVLWDAIFAEGRSFEFINYIVVAMLITIRSQLLNSDYTYCLTYLMRYPTITDIMYIINYALYLKSPETRNPPTFVNHVQNHSVKQESSATIPRSTTLTSTQMKSVQQQGNYRTLKKLTGRRLSKIQTQAIKMNAVPKTTEPETAIVEGFTLHDPEVLRVELNHAHNVMALCQLKLAQYHKVLQRSFTEGNNLHETQQVLDGICELCHLLRSRHYASNYTSETPEVEPALEAGESKLTSSMEQQVTPSSSPSIVSTTATLQQNHIKTQSAPVTPTTLLKSLDNNKSSTGDFGNSNSEFYVSLSLKKEEPLKVFSQVVGVNGSLIPGAPLCDPLRKIKTNDFEMDSRYLFEAVRVLNIDPETLRVK